MELNTNTQTILLMTVYFTKNESNADRPLSPTEWGRFAEWLRIQGMQPKDLMSGDIAALLIDWKDKSVSISRIEQLLNRGMAMSMALEKWSRVGIWVLTRSDDDYPKKLKNRIKKNSPPVFFGVGYKKLLSTPGIAVVGSRHADANELLYTQRIGKVCAEHGYSIFSGGARGVDENAMLGALKAQGTAVGIMADRLLQSCTSKKYRDYLNKNDLVLISPYNPEARFNVGNAMGRNKYISCMADAAIVVRSDKTGGTWNGALENIKHEWVPLWISPNNDPKIGNAELVKKGGGWLPGDNPEEIDIAELLKRKKSGTLGKQQSLLDSKPEKTIESKVMEKDNAVSRIIEKEDVPLSADISLYQFFCQKLSNVLRKNSKTKDELQNEFDVTPGQLNEWLNKSVNDGIIIKNKRPVKYSLKSSTQPRNLFE